VRNSRTALRSESSISGRVVVCMGSSGQFIGPAEGAPRGTMPRARQADRARSIAGDSRDEDKQFLGRREGFPEDPRRGRGVLGVQIQECAAVGTPRGATW
jgi:hypothetical protein